jgi:hypothetical protein
VARDPVTELIALYAALVATMSLVWQIWNSIRSRRPDVRVSLDGWHTSQAHSRRGRRSLVEARVRIYNREDKPVRVDKLYLRYPWREFVRVPWQKAKRRAISTVVDAGDVGEPPFEVAAWDAVTLTVRPTEDYQFPRQSTGRDFTPLVTIELRTGQRCTSRTPGGPWRTLLGLG